MAFVKKAVSSLKAPLAPAKAHPIAFAVVMGVIILVAFRYRQKIMSVLGIVPGANKLAGEG